MKINVFVKPSAEPNLFRLCRGGKTTVENKRRMKFNLFGKRERKPSADYAGAEKEFLKALKLTRTDSLRSVIYGTLGDNRQKMEDGPGAYGYYRKGLKYDPDNSMILNNYSYYLSEKDEKLSLADKMSEKACELSPNNPTYLDTRAWVLFKLGRYEEAKTLMQQALALDQSGSDELFLHYGDILYALKDNFMAVFYWEKAREKGYDSEEIDKRLKQVETK